MPKPELAPTQPVAHVLPLLGLLHLDRGFDYAVGASQDAECRPGVRVRIRFHGRLVDALVLERKGTSDFKGQLKFIERVVSPEVVYPPRTAELIDALAARYAGARSDLIRNVIPSRHAKAEESDFSLPWEDLGTCEEPDLSPWSDYAFGQSFVDAVLAGRAPRAAWQLLPGKPWAKALASLAAKVAIEGGGVLLVVPNQRDVDKLEAALRELVGAKQVTMLTAALGAQARYRRYLSIAHGQARIVIGTRNAVYAPVENLKLCAVMFDSDDNLSDPRAPYAHAREVATTRVALEQCALLVGDYMRTAQAQLLVESGWAQSLVPDYARLLEQLPAISATSDSLAETDQPEPARYARIPTKVYLAMKAALRRGKPVLVQVPRKGYMPSLACGDCRTAARCRACNGPLELKTGGSGETSPPACRWCGRPEPRFSCTNCGSGRLRAVVLGSQRTAEELGMAFAPATVVSSGGNKIVDEVEDKAAIVVATPGSEPEVAGGARYGVVVFLDTWALLSRPDLRAAEDALSKWSQAAALCEPKDNGGEVIVVADVANPAVGAFTRWDFVGHATSELHQRKEVGFPPTVHMAAIDGPDKAIEDFLDIVDLPEGAEVLGPVDLPPSESLPGTYDEKLYGRPQRILVRSPLGPRNELGSALRAAAMFKSASKDELPIRIQVDPIHVG